MGYLLQEPRYSLLKFVYRIASILKKNFSFDSLHLFVNVDFSEVLNLLCILEGHLFSHFGGQFGESIRGVVYQHPLLIECF